MKQVKKYLLHLIAHTHWDREWYRTFEQFRVRLVQVMDKCLEILDRRPDFKYFTLDGQTVIVEDYLEIRPEKKEKLKEYIKRGKILIGPWYTQMDEFLVSGESIVRNLILGHRISAAFGQTMKVGYLPDTFGHISQMPQILCNFGINSVVCYRGVPHWLRQNECIWKSPDGSKVILIYLRDGYWNMTNLMVSGDLPSDPKKTAAIVKRTIAKLLPGSTTRHLLLMKGCDHLSPQEDMPDIIKRVSDSLKNYRIMQSTLPKYVKAVKKESEKMKVITGELRYMDELNQIYPGVLSGRISIKRLNYEAQTSLEKWTEPFASFAWLSGLPYPEALIWRAWKMVLQNQAHDTICGCSIDEVYPEAEVRFQRAKQIAEELTLKSLRYISREIRTAVFGKGTLPLVVFNPTWSERTDTIETVVSLPPGMRDKEFTIINSQGEEVFWQEISHERINWREQPWLVQDGNDLGIRLVVTAENVPSFGYTTYFICPTKKSLIRNHRMRIDRNSLENGEVKVEVNEWNGSVTINHKKTGMTYCNLNHFEDVGDQGDLYNHLPVAEPKISSLDNGKNVIIEIIEEGPVRATLKISFEMQIPERFEEDQKRRSAQLIKVPITTWVSIHSASARVDFLTEVENNADDHWLKVVFPTGIHTEYLYAEGQYEVVKRKIEKNVVSMPQQAFIDVSNGKIGIAILNKGIPYYEAEQNSLAGVIIRLGLLRCVGKMVSSKFNLEEDSSDVLTVGIPYTSEAQCRGKHKFEYSIFPHEGDWLKAKVFNVAHQYCIPLRVVQEVCHYGNLPRELSEGVIKPEWLVIAAVKKAEFAEALVVRCYNILNRATKGEIQTRRELKKAELVNMLEKRIKTLKVHNNRFSFWIRKKEILSFRLYFK